MRRSVLRILNGNVLCSMSTVTPGHRAHINTAYFCCSPDFELYFLSDPRSIHCRNLAMNSSMAMTIFSSSQTWGNPDRGIQLFGTCREAKGSQRKKAERLYAQRFPVYAMSMAGTSGEDLRRAAELRSYTFYRFVPNKVKILDEREFGAMFVVAAVGKRRSR